MKKLLIVLLALCLLLAACTPNPEDEVGSTDPAPTSESGTAAGTTEAPTSSDTGAQLPVTETPTEAPTEEPAGESDGAIHLPKVEF